MDTQEVWGIKGTPTHTHTHTAKILVLLIGRKGHLKKRKCYDAGEIFTSTGVWGKK